MAKRYIAERMGLAYADGIITNLEEMIEESDTSTPMICFLSMGSDPTDNIERLAKKMNLSKLYRSRFKNLIICKISVEFSNKNKISF